MSGAAQDLPAWLEIVDSARGFVTVGPAPVPMTVADMPKVYAAGPSLCVSEWGGLALWECTVMEHGRIYCTTPRFRSEEAAIRRASDIALALNYMLHRIPA